MKEKNIKRAEVKSLEELGYSLGRILEVWESLDGKEDKHFFACLILGGEKNTWKHLKLTPMICWVI